MAGIDRSDSIRRPVDSTLSTRTAHRGGEGQLPPQGDPVAQLRQSSPAIAVVVEQHNLGTPQKPAFELLLSINDLWLRVQSTKPFQPGTVLLVEATADDQIRVLPKLEPAQLNRMMQASLHFWQAHTLPRIHATELPPLPDVAGRAQLSRQEPVLQPLLDWLGQKPALNARTLAAWVQEFMPLNTLQRSPPMPPLPATPLPIQLIRVETASSNWPLILTEPTPTPTPTPTPNHSSTAEPGKPTAALQTPPPTPGSAPVGTQAELPGPRAMLTAPVKTLIDAIRTSLPLLQQQPIRWIPVQAHSDGHWQPLSQTGTAVPAHLIASPRELMQIAVSLDSVVAKPSSHSTHPSSWPVGGQATVTPALPVQLIDARLLQHPERLLALVDKVASVSMQPASAISALQPSLQLPLVQTPTAASSPAITPPAPSNTSWQSLPVTTETSGRVPLEIRLAQWLLLIDDRIRQHPASLQQSLAQRAQQLLRTSDLHYGLDKPLPPPPLPQLHNSGGPHPASRQASQDLQPLLQLRNWLEAVQGKTQNNAIQQTLSALASGGDGQTQTVQQLSIPLIWIGPSAWANLEWWQERAEEDDSAGQTGGKRLWRFRLFFELEPLAPLCADLVWEPQQTDLTFWSEDRSTLAFLNSHLGTLEQWTEGLGERQLHTRHGMPRKKSTPEPDAFKPLVDIHT